MPKCQFCSCGVNGEEIQYRVANQSSRRSRSMRLCCRCAQRYDQTQNTARVRNLGLLAVAVVSSLVAAVYLAIHR